MTITKKDLKEAHKATFKSLKILMDRLSIVNDNVNKLREELREKPISSFDKELINRLNKQNDWGTFGNVSDSENNTLSGRTTDVPT